MNGVTISSPLHFACAICPERLAICARPRRAGNAMKVGSANNIPTYPGVIQTGALTACAAGRACRATRRIVPTASRRSRRTSAEQRSVSLSLLNIPYVLWPLLLRAEADTVFRQDDCAVRRPAGLA